MKKFKIVAALSIAGCLGMTSCDDGKDKPLPGNIEGTVSSYETGQAIRDVMVDIVSNSATTFIKQSRKTGSDGKFSFKNVEAGDYKLSFSRDGYLEDNKDVHVGAGQTVSSDIALRTKVETPPEVSTEGYSDVSQNSATVRGFVSADGAVVVTERGVCYSTSPAPTTSNSKVTGGSGAGSFGCTLSDLSANTTYYARAYAVNSAGTGYGSQLSFTTEQAYSCSPSIETYTSCSEGATRYGNCSTKPNLPNNIKMMVTSITSSTISFSVRKCSGTFEHTGTAYIKEGGVCGTNRAIQSYSIGWYYIDFTIANNLEVGDTKNFYVVLSSSTEDRYYAGPIAITCQ